MVDRSMPALLRNLRKRVTSVERRLTKVSAKTNWADLSPLVIPESSLPSRLRTPTASPASLDTAYDTGWYATTPSLPGVHPPYQFSAGPGYWAVEVTNVGGRSIQVARPWAGTGPVWQRWRNNPGDGSWTAWYRIDRSAMSGSSELRTLTTSRYWDFWFDTTDQRMYVGNKTGGWRLFEGAQVVPTKAWDASSGGVWARSDTSDIPTVLEVNEYLKITSIAIGTGYATMGVSSIVRNPTNTSVGTRLTQFMVSTTQSYTYHWQIATY